MVILYADKVTASMQATMDETQRRRKIQEAYNLDHGIIPQTVVSEVKDSMARHLQASGWNPDTNDGKRGSRSYEQEDFPALSSGEVSTVYHSLAEIRRDIVQLEQEMQAAAERLAFEEAAALRDKIKELQALNKTWT